jgi:hypothetical protein
MLYYRITQDREIAGQEEDRITDREKSTPETLLVQKSTI